MMKNANPQSPISHRSSIFPLFTLLATLISISLAGCTSLMSLGGSSVPPVANSAAGSYRVEMQGDWSKQSVYTGSLDQPTTVQAALEKSGALGKFRNMEITVLRVVDETGQGLKMPIRYDVGEHAVPPEQDYAILPNDRIVVKSISNTIVDEFVKTVKGR